MSAHISEFLKNLVAKVKEEADIGGIIAAYFKTSGGWNSVASLRPDTKLTAALSSAVEKAFDDKFYALVEAKVAEKVVIYERTLESKIDLAVRQRVDRLTNEAIQKRVDSAVEAARRTL
ncbi:hypothetical protein D3C76_1604080 [compost metagenome]